MKRTPYETFSKVSKDSSLKIDTTLSTLLRESSTATSALWSITAMRAAKTNGSVPTVLACLAAVRSVEDKQQDGEAKRVKRSTKRLHYQIS